MSTAFCAACNWRSRPVEMGRHLIVHTVRGKVQRKVDVYRESQGRGG